MRANPGKMDANSTILINNEGSIMGAFLGLNHTMVRNHVVEQLMKVNKLDKEEALNYFDDNFSTVESVPTYKYLRLTRKHIKSRRPPGRPKEK